MYGMEMQRYDVLILSDLHLGSKASRAREALQLLRSLPFRRLILLGDIFCDLNFARLNKEHWQFLSYIRKLSNPKRETEVIWIEGNHDYGLTDVMSHLVGIPVYQEYFWESGGTRCMAIHGHQFDRLILKNNPVINRIVNRLHLGIQNIEPGGRYFTRMVDTMGAQWERMTSRVAKKAIAYAQNKGARYIFCGHTHESTKVTHDAMDYYNAGAWTNEQPTFITMLGQEVQLHEYSERIDNSNTGEKRRSPVASAFGFA
jgi:UDP-2,3-diacylglucosamine pyrophosphatase LpxH